MSSHKSTSENNVDKAFSKLEHSLSKVQEPMPKLELMSSPFKGSLFSFEPAKTIVRWYIDTAEDYADQGIALQERNTEWAKATPWAPLFEAQAAIARKLVKNSAMMARSLWQVQSLPSARHQ